MKPSTTLVLASLAILLTGCSKGLDVPRPILSARWISGEKFFQGMDDGSPEGKALIAAFNKDNGTIYCVPKMSDVDVAETRTMMIGLMVANLFSDFNKLSKADLK